MARAAGAQAIGVAWGYGSREELLGHGAAAYCSVAAELPGTVDRLMAANRPA